MPFSPCMPLSVLVSESDSDIEAAFRKPAVKKLKLLTCRTKGKEKAKVSE